MSYAAECLAAALQPPDRRTPPEWAEEHIKIPNSARGTQRFYRSTNPMMNEPLERSVDPGVRRLVILAPTGAGKSTIIDVRVPFATANSLGSMLVGMQDDKFADDYCEERLMPILDACAPVAALKPTGKNARHLLKKNSRVYPHLAFHVGGTGKSNAQGKSVQWVDVDEAWMIKVHGRLREYEKRLHDRWNGQICVMSQGAVQELPEQKLELAEWWEKTDKAEWSFLCPQCETRQPFAWSQVKYEVVKDGEEINYNATGATARMICANDDCRRVFTDDVVTRRALAESGQYVPTNASKATKGHCGRHFNALTMYWVEWSTLVVEWVEANEDLKDNNPANLIIFITKRLAETYWLPKQEAAVVLTAANYKLSDYFDGKLKIDGELHRFMGVDVQKDHFWVLVRAFRADGSSRLLFAGRIETVDMVRVTQERMQIPDTLVFLDRNYFPTLVDNHCAKYGWIAVEGDKSRGYPINIAARGKPTVYVTRYYSDPAPILTSDGGVATRILFAAAKIKDERDRLRDGQTPLWEHGEGTPPEWFKHIVAERRVPTKDGYYKYERISQRRNDLGWCEAAVTLGAIIMGLIQPAASEPAKDEREVAEETEPVET